MKNQKMLFTAGQFAALNHINKRTLHYYDEIGLFSPACKKENGYRYYTYDQSLTLDLILALRELNMPITEVREFICHRSAAAFQQIVAEKVSDIDASIRHLTELKEILLEKKICWHSAKAPIWIKSPSQSARRNT